MTRPIKWPPEKLDEIIDEALAKKSGIVQPSEGGREMATSLRYALYRRLRQRGIKTLTVLQQEMKVVLLDNSPPEIKMESKNEQ